MKLQEPVIRTTRMIAAGTVVLSGVMLGVFALLKQLDGTVICGALLGSAAAILNFFLMSLSVQKAADLMNGVSVPEEEPAEEGTTGGEDKQPRPVTPEAQEARRKMQLSYNARMMLMLAVAIIGLTVKVFHPIATVIPFLFPRLTVMVYGLTNKEAK